VGGGAVAVTVGGVGVGVPVGQGVGDGRGSGVADVGESTATMFDPGESPALFDALRR